MIDKIEAQNLNLFYLEFVSYSMPVSLKRIMSPITVPHRVQTYPLFFIHAVYFISLLLRYAALAISARLAGDLQRAKAYISQARILAGSVFDSPSPDTGMMLFCTKFV